MKKILVCNGKGGTGKSTTSILLAGATAESGQVVSIKDIDPQQTSHKWIEKALSDVTHFSQDATPKVIIVDSPPDIKFDQLHEEMLSADLIILVMEPSWINFETAADAAAVIDTLGVSWKTRILFNKVQVGTKIAKNLGEMEDRIGITALKNHLGQRQVFNDFYVYGWSYLSQKESDDVMKLAMEVMFLEPAMNEEIDENTMEVVNG